MARSWPRWPASRPSWTWCTSGSAATGTRRRCFPGDPVLAVKDRSVAVTAEHNGHRRMTLTFPVLNRARNVIWFVTGADKAGVVADLYAGGAPFPAGRVARRRAVLVADEAAAREAVVPRRRRPPTAPGRRPAPHPGEVGAATAVAGGLVPDGVVRPAIVRQAKSARTPAFSDRRG